MATFETVEVNGKVLLVVRDEQEEKLLEEILLRIKLLKQRLQGAN